ncbi:DHA2 family efflux MFS transporter permease subunit [Streptomyces sp. NRRL WC-3742]|uniref:DHA2 family efflux MFS transporter permease subunit n=1 Tax=Streptomyces sp. NRRL WC-3742 TaxID=1463934 RepID=UPI00099DE47C|nr:DHA2 family efflux MFS transporter permease subunit [Streptomyces sp. NRRL WC-3742]
MSERSAQGRVSPLLLIALFSGLFLVFLDTTVVNVALPDLRDDLGADVSGLQWVVDSYLLTFSCLLLGAGALADRVGAKKLFVGALAGFVLTSVWCALSGSVGMLLAARAAQGVTGAALMPVSMVIITQLYPDPKARGRMVGIQSAVAGLALTAGPLVGGALVEAYGWQSVFWVNLPVGVLAVAVLARLLPATRPDRGQAVDLLGQLLFVAGVGLLTYALIEGNSAGWGSARIVGCFAAAAALLILFGVWEARHQHPMLPLDFFRHPHVGAGAVINFTVFGAMFGAVFLLMLTLQEVDGLSPVQAGVRTVVMTAMVTIASIVGVVVAERIGVRITALAGALSMGGGLLGLRLLEYRDGFDAYWWQFLLLGLGAGLAGPPVTAALLRAVPEERAGTGSGVGYTARQVGSVFGVAACGTIVSHHLATSASTALAGLPLPPSAVDKLAAGDLSDAAKLPAELRPLVLPRVGTLFMDGTHLAYTAGAAACAVAAIAALLLLGPRPTPDNP